MSAGLFQSGEQFAAETDSHDPLASFRQRFFIPKTKTGVDSVYFCGHSLGLQPKTAQSYLEQELRDWAELGVEGHFHARNPWLPYHRLLTEQTANLVGAKSGEVVVMNSLTVNLHLMMISFYRPTASRHKIVIEGGAFPSDQYAVDSQIRFHGFDPASSLIELRPRQNESCIQDEDVLSLIEREGESIALIMIGGVNYATGQVFDMPSIAEAGRRKGCVIGFDLAHAAGNIPLHLHEWGPDFAVWCSYKYLNGGPGCVAGCFVHERHANSWDLPRFAGWWGHEEKIRFRMEPEFKPMAGAEGWQLSNPPIMAMAPLRASMEIFAEAGIERLREKSISLTGYLEFLLQREKSTEFSIITPGEQHRRGAQISIRIHENGRALCDQLASRGVFGDWREPDTFRVAPTPLYNTYQDAYRFVQEFCAALR
ncbi:MAG TPA: kynureninase [Candidatus Sulfotelmatobacter sp.]|nr:kynureninase [Candidatus Sulfotelmatobacter sp.]